MIPAYRTFEMYETTKQTNCNALSHQSKPAHTRDLKMRVCDDDHQLDSHGVRNL